MVEPPIEDEAADRPATEPRRKSHNLEKPKRGRRKKAVAEADEQ